MTLDLLPSSVCAVNRNTKMIDGVASVQLYCANCGMASGVWTPEWSITEAHGSPFYLCEPCAAVGKINEQVNTMVVPMEAFERAVADEQLEIAGRPMTHIEIHEALHSDSSPLAKMRREQFSKDWSK